MEDRIIKGNKKDRLLKFDIGDDITDFEALKNLLQNGINADMFYNDSGAVQLGTPLNKSTLLKNETANKLNLVGEKATVDGAIDTLDGAIKHKAQLITNLENTKQQKTSARNSFIKADGSGLLIPTTLNKNDVGLSRVDNTRDVDKPVSNHTRNEINNTRNSLQNNINGLQNNINRVDNKYNSGGWILGMNCSSIVGVPSGQVEYCYYGYSTALKMVMACIVIRGSVNNHNTIGLRYKHGFSMPVNGVRFPKAVIESGVGVDNIYRAHDIKFFSGEIQIPISSYTSMKSGQGYLHCNICMPY